MIFDRLRRRRSSPPHDEGSSFSMTVREPDPTRPVECAREDGCLATKWVTYLWRAMERDSFVAGETEEEVCENHFQQLLNDEDVKMEAWGTL